MKLKQQNVSRIKDLVVKSHLTFNEKHLSTLRKRNPLAKYFVYFKLPNHKELPMVVNKGANLKKSIKEQQNHLIATTDYEMKDLTNYEMYDLSNK